MLGAIIALSGCADPAEMCFWINGTISADGQAVYCRDCCKQAHDSFVVVASHGRIAGIIKLVATLSHPATMLHFGGGIVLPCAV